MSLLTTASLSLVSTASLAAYTGHFLIGVDGGFGAQNGTPHLTAHNYPTSFDPGELDLNRDLDNSGGIYSAFAGYEVSDGLWFAGLEASVSLQNLASSETFNGTFLGVPGPVIYATNIEFDRGLTVGVSGRVGLKVHPWVQPYLRVGVEGSKDKLQVNAFTTTLGNVTVMDDRQYNGRLLLGAGIEVPVHTNISLRVEYNYSTPNGTFAHLTSGVGTGGGTADLYHRPHQHLVKGAVTWNFI